MAINLSNTTPAAPAGSINVLWQRDVSGNISAYTTAAAELTVDNIDSTAQAANIAATNLVAAPVQGAYRISVYIVLSQAATTSSTLPSVTITYKDNDSGVTITDTVTATSPGANTTGTNAQATLFVYSASGTAISYATTGYASVGATPMQYALHIRVETL